MQEVTEPVPARPCNKRVTAEEIKMVQAGKMQPRLGTTGMRVIVDETELLAALPSNVIPKRAELSDNGASTGVAKTLLGMIPGTKRAASSSFAVADDKTIGSTVTHLYATEGRWHGYLDTGRRELVAGVGDTHGRKGRRYGAFTRIRIDKRSGTDACNRSRRELVSL